MNKITEKVRKTMDEDLPPLQQQSAGCAFQFKHMPAKAEEPDNKNRSVLSAREKEVVRWLKEGKSSWDISVILGISERTVRFHINNIMQKLDAVNRTHAVAIALEQGLVDYE